MGRDPLACVEEVIQRVHVGFRRCSDDVGVRAVADVRARVVKVLYPHRHLAERLESFGHVAHREALKLADDGGSKQSVLKADPQFGVAHHRRTHIDDAHPDLSGIDHRIDMVFGRTAAGAPLAVDRGEVTGTDVADRDPATGLWPSDHGGVVLRLRGL